MGRINLRMPEDIHSRAKDAAWESRQSLNGWIVEAINEKLERRNTMDEYAAWKTLYEIHSGMTDLPMVRSHWPEDHIDFLEDQGCITVREYDGEIRVTSDGVAALHLMKSMSKGGDLKELNPRFDGE